MGSLEIPESLRGDACYHIGRFDPAQWTSFPGWAFRHRRTRRATEC